MGKVIGKIVEVKGTVTRAELKELLPPYIVEEGRVVDAPKINTFVKTKVGLNTIICQITGEYCDDNKLQGKFTGYYITLAVKGHIFNGKFQQGLRCMPIVNAEVEMLDKNDIATIYKIDETVSILLGNDLYNENQQVYLNVNLIVPSHVGIFGNTGSGKSNTLAKILSEYSEIINEKEKAKILIFDLNNEYSKDSICREIYKTTYVLSTRTKEGKNKIPFNVGELNEDEWCILLGATEATQRPVIKTAFKIDWEPERYKGRICDMLRNGQRSLFNSLRFHMSQYIDNIDNFEWHSVSQCFYCSDDNGNKVFCNDYSFKDYLDAIKIEIPEDSLQLFLFKLYFATVTHIGYGTQYEYIEPMLRRAEKLIGDFDKVFDRNGSNDLFNGKNIAVIQLANVNKDLTEIIPAIISMHLFTKQVEEKQDDRIKSIVNIVIDEAHNLLYEDEGVTKHKLITLEAFEKIVKEGRKYGVFLWISSQRPSDISPTIISQMHNYFIHKLVNPLDLAKIRKAVAFLDEESMNMITVLGPGECVLSGTSVAMPVFTHVVQVDAAHRPNSENVVLIGPDGIIKNNDVNQPFIR